MNVVDSSAWLEYFADGPNAEYFAGAVEGTESLVVPTLSLYEVFKRILQQRTEADALQATAVMQQGTVADLTAGLALDAARLSVGSGLPLADAVMLATARAHRATFWTQDSHFEGMAGVEFRPAEPRTAGRAAGARSPRRRPTG
ncbi:MAG: type II toxin-antitoxin system VapC family toxin [Deltaproteobacteria bacterium]|nr:type II toxin-antitoxin system VapC family toxin [Deltaproteobacteria bacterium]